MAIEYNFTLDMDRSKRDNNIAYARTGDVDSITINADLVLNGAAYTPAGTNAFFECVTPNGHSVRAAAQKSGSSVSVEVPSAAFQAAGVINVAYFRFETGDSSNPTYVESTEPFAIVVREGIGDNIDAGDYIEEWRGLADKLEAAVAEVEKKAEQAETAINEQKTEVDQLKAQAQKAIAGDVTKVEETAQSAIAAINKEKADVADAAEDISAAGEQAINAFNTNSQQAISQFNTNGTSAINKFNTKADGKLEEVDGMITDAQGDVDAAITQLESATDKAVSAMEDALGGTTAGSLQNAINRTLKLDIADMTNITDSTKLSSLTNVGSYCCKTAASAAKISDSPVDDSPFNMYVFSSSTPGQVMQLVVPIDLNGKPTAEWHVRFGTSSAMDKWSVIGGGAGIAAGLGIDITGDAKKTVSIDTDAFYQHHEAASIIHGSTEVTGGGRIKGLTAYGNTRQNLWVNPSGTSKGITVRSNPDGSVTISGTTESKSIWIGYDRRYILRSGGTYTLSVNGTLPAGVGFRVESRDENNAIVGDLFEVTATCKTSTLTVPANASYFNFIFYFFLDEGTGTTLSGTYCVMLNEGSEAEPWCSPGLNSVDELSLVTSGKNLLARLGPKLPYITGGITFSDNGDGGIRISGTSTSNAFFNFFSYADKTTQNLPAGDYVINLEGQVEGVGFSCGYFNNVQTNDYVQWLTTSKRRPNVSGTLTTRKHIRPYLYVENGATVDTVVYPQLELGSTATDYEPPQITTTPIDLDGHTLNSLPDGTRDELAIDAAGAVKLTQRVGVATAPTEASGYTWLTDVTGGRASFPLGNTPVTPSGAQVGHILCDKLPPRTEDLNDPSYIIVASNDRSCVRNPAITSTAKAATVAGGATLLYPLATPKVIPLASIEMPELASPSYVIFASSSVPAEIEADVVKVDYLHPSDVYTKEEVDKKINDAGMPDIVPVSKGGTGVTTAAAERNRLGLGNTTGALPVANGGTGATTAKAAQYNLLNSIAAEDSSTGDGSLFTFTYVSPSSAKGVLYKRTGSNVWNWIVVKIRSTFGFNSSNVLPVANGGTGSNTPEGARKAIGAGTSNFGGSYNDLTDKPQIPSVPVSVANGGTGGTSAKAAQNSLLNDMTESSAALTDSSMLVGYNISPSASNGAVHKRSALTIWNYVVGKIRSTFGFTSSNVLPVSHGGTGLTANPSMLVNLRSGSASNVLTSSPRPGVTGTLPVSHGGTGATAPGVDMLRNLGITFGTADPPSTGTPGSIYIQYFK